MAKFKVGDIVVGNQDNEVNGVEQGQLYEVIATEVEGAYDYIMTDLSLGCWVRSERFDLYKVAPYQEEQDDPLPPAPESALYVNKWSWGVGVRNLGDEVQIGTGNPNSRHGWTYATLDPDSALQLAHDLNRMANEIKRKEKRGA